MTSALLTGTEWGWGWIAQVVAAAAALGIAARRDDLTSSASIAPVEVVGGLAAVVLAVSAAMSGHPAAANPAWLAVGLDAGHVLAAGGWIGTLAYVALAGVPATGCMQPDCRPPVVRDLITSFSTVAIVCVAAIVVTGLASSWIQMQSVAALWTTPYGRILLIKLGLFALVGAVGAYNWRVTTPRVLATGGIARMRAAIGFELLFAVLLLGATAVLVATPPPAEAMDGPTSAVVP
jgi:putative copper export protein